jgi:hypothetical protein
MATKTDTGQIYQIKVTLLRTRPPIWRRLLVPANMNLAALHAMLQLAFDWQDCHLHEFRVGQQRYGALEMLDPGYSHSLLDESKFRLRDLVKRVGDKVLYTYDLGDDWQHSVALEKIVATEAGIKYPICIGGKNQAPPEDSGGIPGFYNLQEALADPDHEEHEDLLEWLGEDFNPGVFSKDAINERLRKVFQ